LSDVTGTPEHKRAETQTKETVEWQTAVFDGSRDAVFISDSESRFVSVNKAACNLTGFTRQELLTMRIPDLHKEPDLKSYYVSHERIMQGEEILSEAKIRRRDGSKVDTEFNNTRIVISGTPYVHTTARDITAHKQVEEALRQAEEFTRAVLDGIPGLLYLYDDRLRLVRWNKQHENVTGYSAEELSGRYMLDWFREPDRTRIARAAEYALLKGTARGEADLIMKDGSSIPYYFTGIKATIAQKAYIAGIAVDMTERKRVEEALRESKERFRNLVENITDVFYVSDPGGKLVYGSPNLFTKLGYTPAEIIGRSYVRLVAPVDRRRVIDYYVTQTRLGALDAACEFRALRKDGAILWAEQRTRIVRDGAGKVIENRNVIRNVTDRKQTEEALQKSETRFRTLFEQAGVGVAIIESKTGCFVEINAKYCNILEYTKEEMLRITFQAVTHPDDLQVDLDNMELLQKGAINTFSMEKRYLRKDGQIVWVNLTVSPLWKTGEPMDFHVAVVEDISARKQAEEIARTYSKHLMALSKHFLNLQENERRSLARELHDEIGQALTSLKIHLEMSSRTNVDTAKQNVKDAIRIAGDLVERIRGISFDLRPPILDDLGLVPAIRWHLLEQTGKAGIKGHFTAEPEEIQVSREIATACFRVAQEALTNVLRHSKAKSVDVQLVKRGSNLDVAISDDGTGFDVESAIRRSSAGKSFGLLGMQERVKLVGGDLVILSEQGGGSKIKATFPDEIAASSIDTGRLVK
ncbi:MAG TPA: PAS domain S-box protein, partial [Bacteroidota bacterium]|nr:PAS domain S-box protein [Bacteroidota bacterium]